METPPPRAEPKEAPPSEKEADADRARVLVVEDHHETKLFLRMALQERYRVDTAKNAGEALQRAGNARYDALLIDIALGSSKSGLDLVKALRRNDAYAETPAAAVTAYAFDEDRRHFLESGFDAYLSKPFFQEDLLALVERLLSKG